MHGHERRRKDFGVDHHELYVRLYAIERKNKGRILEPCEQAIKGPVSETMIHA